MVGFDNIFGSDFTTPTLITISSPFKACGAAALDLLVAALAGPERAPAR
ncbi:hypothetical protein [Arthrobacter globiformis]|nr:hypothetical protein [Arthrobacter globiformis]MDQ0618487.1 DNA-binding LacI/PurR family transcriptional regulator [Arthrobacter globiformis]